MSRTTPGLYAYHGVTGGGCWAEVRKVPPHSRLNTVSALGASKNQLTFPRAGDDSLCRIHQGVRASRIAPSTVDISTTASVTGHSATIHPSMSNARPRTL